MPNPRKIAVDVLFNILKGGYINSEMDRVRKIADLTETDLKFINEIVRGVVKNKIYLDEIIKGCSTVKFNKISPYILCILEAGAYQILFMDRVPQSAAVNESVKIVKKSSSYRLSSYVNAVLRSVARKAEENEILQDNSELHIKYSYPKWLTDRWIDTFGEEFTKNMLDAFSKKPPFIIRANTLKTSAQDLALSLTEKGFKSHGVKTDICPALDCMLECEKISDIENLDEYKDGMFYVQDISSAVAVMCSSVKPGDTVIDMCSAPGGKATFMAELMKNSGKIYAYDIYDQKIDKIRQNASRLGIDIINAHINDASVYNEKLCDMADVVFCDVPCSGFGILRKKPDIKFKRCEDDILELAELGLKILNNAACYVKHGGTLIFSTCTIDPCENEENLKRFLKENPEFELKKIDCINKENAGYFTTYPHTDGTDGFFVAKMIRK